MYSVLIFYIHYYFIPVGGTSLETIYICVGSLAERNNSKHR